MQLAFISMEGNVTDLTARDTWLGLVWCHQVDVRIFIEVVMANEEQLAILKQGVEVWNKWRNENPKVEIDLTTADLSRTNLGGANLIGADLREVNLRGAFLSDANLNEANLHRSDLGEANLTEAD